MNIMRLLPLFATTMNLQCIYTFNNSINHHTPTYNIKRCSCSFHWLEHQVYTYKKQNAWNYPPNNTYTRELHGCSQCNKHIYGSKNKDYSKNIHQPCNEACRHQSKDNTKNYATNTHNRECWALACKNITLCIGNGYITQAFIMTLCTIICGNRNNARKEKQYANGNSYPCYCLFTILNEQHSYNNISKSAKNGTT